MEKRCFKCEETKPLEEFYRHPQMADGHLNKCKACAKSDVSTHREANIDKVRSYDRVRGLTEDRKRRVKELRAKTILTPEGRDRLNATSSKWREKNKAKRAAHLLVQYAVRRGDMIKMPCERCGNEKSDAHHEDYTKPMDVMWLCKKCHGERHREINEGRR